MGVGGILFATSVTMFVMALVVGAFTDNKPKWERFNSMAVLIMVTSFVLLIVAVIIALWEWVL